MGKEKDCREDREKWPWGKQEINGITYDTEDQDTRLIGYRGPGAFYLTEQKSPIPASRLYYNTWDMKYFMHTIDGDINPVDAATGRYYMENDGGEGFKLCISEDEKEKIKQSDGLNKRR